MADLYITPTRRYLLIDIRNGLVFYAGPDWVVPAATRSGRRTVTAAVRELLDAGLVNRSLPVSDGDRLTLTAAGLVALDGGEPPC